MSAAHSILFIYFYSGRRFFLKRKRHFLPDSAEKAKKEVFVPPKTEAKATTLNAKKTVLKGIYSTPKETKKKKTWKSPRFQQMRHWRPSRAPPNGTSFITILPSNSPEDRFGLEDDQRELWALRTVDVQASKPWLKQRWQGSVNLTGQGQPPDGVWWSKEEYVPWVPDYGAWDITANIGIIWSGFVTTEQRKGRERKSLRTLCRWPCNHLPRKKEKKNRSCD